MGGGKIQLKHDGLNGSLRFTGNPQITFFKSIYRRHTPFAIESIVIEHTRKDQSRATYIVPHHGDLLHKMYIECPVADSNVLGYALISSISVRIGSDTIDTHTGEFLMIWHELTSGMKESLRIQGGKDQTIYLPLAFWFCRDTPFPLIALQNQEFIIEIDFTTTDSNDTNNYTEPIQLYGDFIFLGAKERRMVAQSMHEYLIETVDTQTFPRSNMKPDNWNPQTDPENKYSGTFTIPMHFIHPTKELIWVVKTDHHTLGDDYYACGDIDFFLNDSICVTSRQQKYFTLVQPYYYHTNIPKRNNINVLSFSLHPEDHQPSGTLILQQNHKFIMHIYLYNHTDTIELYSVHYKRLRIASGVCGIVG